VNVKYCRENGIEYYRRKIGGWCVYAGLCRHRHNNEWRWAMHIAEKKRTENQSRQARKLYQTAMNTQNW